MQEWGLKRKATNVEYSQEDSLVKLSMNIEEAYPDSAGLKSWRRSFSFDRNAETIELAEAYELEKRGPDIMLSFMSPGPVRIEESHITIYPGGDFYAPRKLTMDFDPKKFEAVEEKIEVKDPRLKSIWGDSVIRVLLKHKRPKSKGEFSFSFKISETQ